MSASATVAVACSITVKSPVALLNSRVAKVDDAPMAIVSAPAVELKRTVPLLLLKVALLSNDPPILTTPVGNVTIPPISKIKFPNKVTLVSVNIRVNTPVPLVLRLLKLEPLARTALAACKSRIISPLL